MALTSIRVFLLFLCKFLVNLGSRHRESMYSLTAMFIATDTQRIRVFIPFAVGCLG